MPSNLKCLICGQAFLYPATLTETKENGDVLESKVCPFCRSIKIDLQEPEVPIDVVQPTNVYVYDLKTGANPELDTLLSQGYQIVGRYAKQYNLEKFPQTETKPEKTDVSNGLFQVDVVAKVVSEADATFLSTEEQTIREKHPELWRKLQEAKNKRKKEA